MASNAPQCLCTGGNRTLGYKIVDKKHVIDPETAPAVKTIFEMYVKGSTPPEILQYLRDNNFKSVNGTEFKQNSVYYMLKNKKYCGYYIYNKKEVIDGVETVNRIETKGGIPAIITEELFNQAQEVMAKKKKAPARAKAIDEGYLLSGSMSCGICGRTVIGVSGTSKTGGKKHFYYRCSAGNYSKKSGKRKKCDLKSNRKQDLEDFVVEKTLERLTPERINDIANKIVELCKKEREDKCGLTALEKRLKRAKSAERNLLKALKSGKAQEALLNELDKVAAEQKNIEREIIKESNKYPLLTADKVKFFIERFTKGDITDYFFREKLVDTFIQKIKVYNDKITIWYNVQDGYFVDYSTVCISSDLAGVEGLEPS